MRKLNLFLITAFLLFPALAFARADQTITINCEVVSVMTLRVNYPKLSARIAFEGENFSLETSAPEISYSCTDKCLLQVNESNGIKFLQLSSAN